LSTPQDFQTFAGDIFTVQLVDTKPAAAKVRFCATAPYQGGSIPVTRSPWGLQDQHGTVWPADEGDVTLGGNTYPVDATVSVGDCLQGWIGFNAPASTTPMRVVYDSSIGGPFTWDVTLSGAKTLPDPPVPQSLPTEPPVYSNPQRDCYTLESAAAPFSGNWLTRETRGQFTDETLRLQDRLNWMGYGCIPEDGDYGPVTREAVMRFQRDFGLIDDGNVGPQTWETIFTYD
jgi:peptidoglycan hydrolase-like protein with peptidoglycan-binding domain